MLHQFDGSSAVEHAPVRSRILLADDHELILDMLRRLLEPEFDVVGAASDGSRALELAHELSPDVVLLDMIMPGLSGLDVGKALHSGGSATKLIFLTMETDPAIAMEAFDAGASAYMSKASPAAELQRVIRLITAGGRYLAPTIAGGDIDALAATQSADPKHQLSPRELEVLKLLLAGMPMKGVARNLGIAPRTVAFHKYRAMDQLGLRNNSELIDFAIRHRLLGATGEASACH